MQICYAKNKHGQSEVLIVPTGWNNCRKILLLVHLIKERLQKLEIAKLMCSECIHCPAYRICMHRKQKHDNISSACCVFVAVNWVQLKSCLIIMDIMVRLHLHRLISLFLLAYCLHVDTFRICCILRCEFIIPSAKKKLRTWVRALMKWHWNRKNHYSRYNVCHCLKW